MRERETASQTNFRDPPFVCWCYYWYISVAERVIKRRRSTHLRPTEGSGLLTGSQFRYRASFLGAVAVGKLRDGRIATPLQRANIVSIRLPARPSSLGARTTSGCDAIISSLFASGRIPPRWRRGIVREREREMSNLRFNRYVSIIGKKSSLNQARREKSEKKRNI